MEKNQRESNRKTPFTTERIRKTRIVRDLSRGDILHLIYLYKENECLWNYKRHQYNRFDLRNEAWERIARSMHISADDAKRKMKSLRSTYLAEKKKLDFFRGSNPDDKYISSLFYFDNLRFLDDAIIPRQCHSDGSSTNKEKIDVDLIHSESKTSTTSSLMIVDDNEPEQQYYQNQQQVDTQNQEIYDDISTSSFPSLSSNFHQVQSNRTQQQRQHENTKHPHLSTLLSSERKIVSEESTAIKSTVQNAPCSSRSLNAQNKTNSESHGDRVSSKEVLSAAYDFIQKDTSNEWPNLKSFGEFIDAELQKLDENSLAVAKMKINEILHEAALGMYKNVEDMADKSGAEFNTSRRERLNDVSDSETERKSNNHKRPAEIRLEKNKENQIPTTSQHHEQYNLRSDNDLRQQQASVFRKKRLKSKRILSAVYNVLSKEIHNVESQSVSFAAYVCSELKTMDNETRQNAKLNICRVLYEASVGKYKNQTQTQTDAEVELVTPKIEVIDAAM